MYINVLFIGDVIGKPGLSIVEQKLIDLKEQYKPDLTIVNGENVTNGKGIIARDADFLFDLGVDIITTGNHVWDNWKGKPLLAENPLVLRPFNYPPGNVGRGFAFFAINENITAAVVNIQGRTFMQTIDCPFRGIDYALNQISEKTNIIIVDFHADATAEKQAMSHYLDGRVSALLGTHTHIPTADHCIMPQGMAYITDVGMTGPYDSVVGMRKDVAIKRFTMQTPYKYEMAADDVRLCGVFIKIDPVSGKSVFIQQIIDPMPNRGENIA
jgi:2',3'-cyclic-nucleotide 2'-phosphodiesterase